MKLSTKVAYNTIIQVISKVISTILGLIAVAIMTRYLGQFGFGEYTTAMTFLSFFAIAADLGLTLVTSQMVSQPGADEEKIIGNLLALRLVSALVLLGLAPFVVFLFPYSIAIKIAVLIAALSFFFVALNQIMVGLFQKHLRMEKVAIAEVLSRLFLVCGIIAVAYYNKGLLGMMIATTIASFTSFIIHFLFARSFVRLRLFFDRDVWSAIFKQSWPIAVTIIFNLIYLKTDTLILSLIKSQEEVGVYGAAYKVIDVLVTIPFMFAGVILPILTSCWLRNEKEKFNKVIQRSFDAMVMFSIPMSVGTFFVADRLMSLVAGKDFAVAGPVLQILILAASIIFIGCMFAHALIAIDKQKRIIIAYVFTSLTSLIGYLYFIPKYSYFGAAWVTVYSELAIAIASLYLVYKYGNIKLNFAVLWKTIAASLLMALCLWIFSVKLPNINIVWMLVIGTISYFVFIYIFKGVSKNDINDLLGRNVQ